MPRRPHLRAPVAFVGSLLVAISSVAEAIETEMTDANITDAVEREFRYDHAVPFHDVDVTTLDGVVTLIGTVDNLLARERAVLVAETVKGVRAIVDRLSVRPEEHRSDAAIGADVEAALLGDPATDSYEVEVSVRGGHVTLSGTVQSWKEHDLAARVAKGVRGVVGLTNELGLSYAGLTNGPGRSLGDERPDAEIRLEIEQALRWNTLVDDALIEVSVQDGTVELSGIVGSAAEKRQARLEAWTTGVASVDVSALRVDRWARDDDLRADRVGDLSDEEIRDALERALAHDPRVRAFGIDVSVVAGNATLRGVVDNLKARRAAEADAFNTFGVRRVDDYIKVRPAPGTPDREVENRIRAALTRDPYLWSQAVEVRVRDGHAHLDGTVASYFEKGRAEDLTSRVRGVVEITNGLDVESARFAFDSYLDDWRLHPDRAHRVLTVPSTSDLMLEDDITSQLWWSPFVDEDQVRVEVDRGIATLTGTVDSWLEWGAAQDNAYDAGAVYVRNELRVQ